MSAAGAGGHEDPDPPAESHADVAAGDQAEPRHPFLRALGEGLVLLAVALVVAVGLRTFVGQAFFIPSASMVPQLEGGDRVIVSKLSYRLHEPRRGDVVVFHCPPQARCPAPVEDSGPARAARVVLESIGLRHSSTEDFIKRVIALPGETVEGRDGSIYIDGKRLVEPYLPEGTHTVDFPAETVPEGALWVMGDNRGHSEDSRFFGPIEQDSVVGRSFVRAWPPGRVAFM